MNGEACAAGVGQASPALETLIKEQTADGWYVSVLKAAASLQKERSVGLTVIESCRKNLRQKNAP